MVRAGTLLRRRAGTVDHRVVVSIQRVLPVLGVARDVDLRHALRGNAIDVGQGIEIVILRGDVNVVHVQQNPTIGLM